MANAFPIAEGELEINANPDEAWRNVQEFLRRVDQRLHASEDEAERSGRRSGHRFGEGFGDGLRGGLPGGGLINNLLPNGGGGEGGGGEGGGGGGFIQGLLGGLTGGFRRVLDEIRSLIADIESALAGLGGGGGGFLSDLRDSLNDLIGHIRSGFISLMTYLHGVWTRVLGTLGGIPVSSLWTRFLTWIRLVWSRFSTWANTAFSALWTRISTWASSMMTAARVIWTRFTTWAIATFSTLRALGSVFWARFRGWATTTMTTIALVAGILFSRMRAWATGVWTRVRSWGLATWASLSTRARALWTRFTTWARSAWSSITTWFNSLFTTISSWASTLGTQLGKVFGALGQAGPVLQIAMYASLVPIILSLGGAIANLLPLLLLLPAAIGSLIAIIAPAIVAFKGLGEAIGAGLSGDIDKFNESLKKLTPNARAFVKEFVKLGPVLKDIKRRTQDAMFKPLLGTIAPLAKTFFPALAVGMEKVAGALGRLLAGFAKMLGTPEVISAINALFATAARILDTLGPAIANLFGALFGTVEGGLPWIERLVSVLAQGINEFANWLRLIKGNGDMQRWLETAWSTAKDVWEVLKQLGLIVKNLFANTGDEGTTFLQGLADTLKDINEWLTSRDGKDFIDVLASSVVALVWVFKGLAWVVWFTVEAFLGLKNAGIFVWHWLEDVWAWLVKAYHAVADWLSMAAGVSWDWLKNAASAVGDFFQGVGKWFVDAYNFIAVWLGRIMDWFAQIPGWIGQFFSSLPGWIAAGLAALRDAVFYSIGYIAGLIVQTFMGLPGFLAQVWTWIKDGTVAAGQALWNEVSTWPGRAWNALSSLGSTLLGLVEGVWDSLFDSTTKGVQKTTDQVSQLPGKAADAISAMPGAVGRWVSDTWNKAVDGTMRGVDSVTSTVRSLYGKVTGALSGIGSWLWDAGANMIRGLVNGISGLLGWAVDQAYAAARKVKEGFLDSLGIKSPSRVMRVEVGRQILPGVIQGIEDTIPDTQRYLGAMANMMIGGFQPTVNVSAPQVDMGSTVLHADFGDGIRQAVPLIITRNPRIVAGAAAVGNRERSGWVNTNRGVMS